MIVKQKLLIVCTISIIVLLIMQNCDASRSRSGSRKSSSGRGSTSGRRTSTGKSGNRGSWLSTLTGRSRSSSSKVSSSSSKVSPSFSKVSSSSSKISSSATKKKPVPSAPRYEEKKHIGWKVQGGNNNPGAPPPHSNTHTKGQSNPSLQNTPPHSKNSPPGHQTIQSNNNPNQGLNYPRNTAQQSAGNLVQSNTGGGSSSSSSKVSSSATQKKPIPSAPRYEETKHIGWNVQGVNNNPGAPPPYSNTHTKDLSNPSLQNAPPYSKNRPPGHQTIQSNNSPNQNQGLNYPRNTAQKSAGYPVQSNVQGQYPEINYPKNTGQQQSGYPGGAYQGGHYPNQGGHYSGMNYGGGTYTGYSGYSPAAPNGYFASGYPVGIVSGNNERSGSGSSLTNSLLAENVRLRFYNAIRPHRSYYRRYGGGSTVHNHYYNNQAPRSNPNSAQAPIQSPAQAQATPSNLAPMPNQASIPLANNNSADPTNALVTPLPPMLAPNDIITDLDCVYAMKILNCSEISQCPQEWLHPSCLNRTISKKYYDSITLPPPPPMPEANVDQTSLAAMSGQAGIPLANNNSADPANALVTPPPPALAINEKITNLDCAMNCSEISQCPQEWRYPCLNRTISKEYFDGITLPPPPSPPPMPQAKQITPEKFADPRDMTDLHQNKNEDRNSTVYLAHSQQMAIVSSSSSSTRASVSTGCSLCFVIFFGMAVLKSSLQLKF